MAKRKIIKIDENLCDGCGRCIHACSEGALKLVNGKAKLVREDFCDGFGDCLGECPAGALTIEEKDAPEFDFRATLDHVTSSLGSEGVDRFLHAAREHGLIDHPLHAAISPPPTKPAGAPALRQGGCPGSRHVSRTRPSSTTPVAETGLPGKIIESDLAQWPVQLHLVTPGADFFSNRELVVLSTCAPVASADVHWRFLRGRSAVVACPKLDRTEPYEEKLAAILSNPTIPKVIVVRMSVPCCGGLTHLVTRAMERIERNDLEFQEIIVDIDGHIRG